MPGVSSAADPAHASGHALAVLKVLEVRQISPGPAGNCCESLCSCMDVSRLSCWPLQHQACICMRWARRAAAQAMLEADPTSREPRDSYLARYQAYARDELDEALLKYDQLQSSLGEMLVLYSHHAGRHRTPDETIANLLQQLQAACA